MTETKTDLRRDPAWLASRRRVIEAQQRKSPRHAEVWARMLHKLERWEREADADRSAGAQ